MDAILDNTEQTSIRCMETSGIPDTYSQLPARKETNIKYMYSKMAMWATVTFVYSRGDYWGQ